MNLRFPLEQRSGSFRSRGFSLVEITLAMGIAAVAMVSILGMLPQAMKYSRDSADQTAIGAVLEDVHDRLKGQNLVEGPALESPFFYDKQGRFWSANQGRPNTLDERRFFRVEVRLTKPQSPPGIALPEDMLAAVVELFWPLDQRGEVIGRAKPKTTVTYMVTTLTGPDWQEIDPHYEPKLEY